MYTGTASARALFQELVLGRVTDLETSLEFWDITRDDNGRHDEVLEIVRPLLRVRTIEFDLISDAEGFLCEIEFQEFCGTVDLTIIPPPSPVVVPCKSAEKKEKYLNIFNGI